MAAGAAIKLSMARMCKCTGKYPNVRVYTCGKSNRFSGAIMRRAWGKVRLLFMKFPDSL